MKEQYIYIKGFLKVILLSTFSVLSSAQNITDTLYKEAEIYQLLDQIEEDPMLQLEWLTAVYFHKSINDYRIEKKVKPIHWDHKLWMASRNHNVYLMRDIKHLSHNQSKNNPFYSGRYPEDRVEYVTYQSKEFVRAGYENCNFSGSSFRLDRINQDVLENLDKETMKKLAQSTAEDGFEDWKNSMGHNQNMLNAEHLTHGTSFVFGQSGIYGTSVFAGLQRSYRPDDLFIPFILSNVNKSAINILDNYQEINVPKNEIHKIKYKHFFNMADFFESKEIKRSRALYDMSKMEQFPKNEKEMKKAYRKARGLRGFYELLSNQIKFKTFKFKLSLEEFQKLKGVSIIRDRLNTFYQDVSETIKYWGGHIVYNSYDDKMELELRIFYLV